MPDSKHMKWADNHGTDAGQEAKAEDSKIDSSEPAANDADGWQQYRRWVSKAPAPRGRRSGIDPSLYSWKGYRDWSDQVKRSWNKDQDGEN
ncbi:MAG: hypothetical protein K0U72_09100 [Gammaproteobacteria bacterium]|nr:hypothetical protein [Gammaproteobacteria bacterium]